MAARVKSPRVKVTVSGRGYLEGWKIDIKGIDSNGLLPKKPLATKRQALEAGQKICRKLEDRGIKSSLIAKNRKGKIQWEWSYPKHSDPRPKPGSNKNRGVARQAPRKPRRRGARSSR